MNSIDIACCYKKIDLVVSVLCRKAFNLCKQSLTDSLPLVLVHNCNFRNVQSFPSQSMNFVTPNPSQQVLFFDRCINNCGPVFQI